MMTFVTIICMTCYDPLIPATSSIALFLVLCMSQQYSPARKLFRVYDVTLVLDNIRLLHGSA